MCDTIIDSKNDCKNKNHRHHQAEPLGALPLYQEQPTIQAHQSVCSLYIHMNVQRLIPTHVRAPCIVSQALSYMYTHTRLYAQHLIHTRVSNISYTHTRTRELPCEPGVVVVRRQHERSVTTRVALVPIQRALLRQDLGVCV